MTKKISEKTIRVMRGLFRNGLSVTEISRRTNIPYVTVHRYTKLKQKINPETGKRFISRTEYEEHLARQRQQQPINQKLSDYIKRRLNESGKSQSQLARETGVTKQAMSMYAQGKYIPNEDTLNKLCSNLKIQYLTLDDLLK